MILLRRRNKPNILEDIKSYIDNSNVCREDYILKLDRRHIERGRNNIDVTINKVHHPLRKEIQKATLVAYKKDWNNPKDNLRLRELLYRLTDKEDPNNACIKV
jgi:hypothetical protein